MDPEKRPNPKTRLGAYTSTPGGSDIRMQAPPQAASEKSFPGWPLCIAPRLQAYACYDSEAFKGERFLIMSSLSHCSYSFIPSGLLARALWRNWPQLPWSRFGPQGGPTISPGLNGDFRQAVPAPLQRGIKMPMNASRCAFRCLTPMQTYVLTGVTPGEENTPKCDAKRPQVEAA